jgi:putative transposase
MYPKERIIGSPQEVDRGAKVDEDCRRLEPMVADQALVTGLRELASRWPRWGSRRLHILLRREGADVNHRRVYRVYRLEGLAGRRRRCMRRASA